MLVLSSGGCELYGYFHNAHGDVTGLYQGDYCYAEYDYDAYGNVVSCSETGISNPIRYAGYYYDTDTQNYYLMNRYYSPYQGRFLTLDPYWNVSNMLYGKFTGTVQKRVYYPAVVQSGNRFAYCLNNPLRFYDPLGVEIIVVPGGVMSFGYNSDGSRYEEFKYQFIETALNEIVGIINNQVKLQSQTLGTIESEELTWIIINYGYSDDYIQMLY